MPPTGRFSFLFFIIIMVSKILPGVASDQYAEKKCHPTLHLSPLPSMISNWQLPPFGIEKHVSRKQVVVAYLGI